MDVIKAITERASTRAFLDKPVAKSTVHDILNAARFAPSGVNTQPWSVAVLQDPIKQQLSTFLIEAFRAGTKANLDYQYYPTNWFEPYKTRRFACGMALYGALDIKREDTARRKEVWELNYHFFHAPIGLIFLIDDTLEKGSWMDVAMFIQNVMLAARGFGLETCPQASIAEYPDIVRAILKIPANKLVVCGMALGYADYDHPVNKFRTEREAVDSFTTWYE